jgi:hypothetical protein
MSCECILQSGNSKGYECGRKLKPRELTCGIHRKTCKYSIVRAPAPRSKSPVRAPAPRSKSPVRAPAPRSKSPVRARPEIIKFINNLVLDESNDILTKRIIRDRIKKQFGIKVTTQYVPYIVDIARQKTDASSSASCSRCTASLMDLNYS